MTVKSQLALPSGEAGARKQFIRVNIAKAGAGIMLATAFIVLVGKPNGAEMLALSGLCIPLLLACLGWTPLPRRQCDGPDHAAQRGRDHLLCQPRHPNLARLCPGGNHRSRTIQSGSRR